MKSLSFLKITINILFILIICISCDFFGPSEKVDVSDIIEVLSGENSDWKKAKILAEKASRQKPQDHRVKVLLALAYEQHGQITAAVDELRRAIKIAPNDFNAQFMLGRLYYENGKYDDALAPLEKANQIEPQNNIAAFYLARTYQKLRQLNKAKDIYLKLVKAPEFGKLPDLPNEMGIALFEQERYAQANQCFTAAYRKAPENHKVLWNLAVLNDFYLNNPQTAINFYNKFQEVSLINPELASKREEARKRIAVLESKTRIAR